MSKLLINETPLQVLPSLAKAIGLNEAIVIQQIHWLLNCSKHYINGRFWLFNTYEQWQSQHFPFWSVETVKRTILSLEKWGLLISTTEFNKMKVDKTKWYSIDYEKLAEIENTTGDFTRPSGQNDPSNRSNCPDVTGQNDPTNNQERSQERSTRDIPPLPQQGKSADADGTPASSLQIEKNQIDYQGVMSAWNLVFADTPIPKLVKLNDERRRKIGKVAKELISEFGNANPKTFEDYFRDFLAQATARKDKFYFGGVNAEKWIADFDYVMRPATLLKTLENGL